MRDAIARALPIALLLVYVTLLIVVFYHEQQRPAQHVVVRVERVTHEQSQLAGILATYSITYQVTRAPSFTRAELKLDLERPLGIELGEGRCYEVLVRSGRISQAYEVLCADFGFAPAP